LHRRALSIGGLIARLSLAFASSLLIDRNARRLDTLAASATFALKDDLIAALQGISPVLATVSDLPAFGG